MATPQEPPITIAIASHDGWPTLREMFESYRAQAQEAGGKIILIDGSGGTPHTDEPGGPLVRWIRMPGADIAELRMRGYREARGTIVAMTEDHCAPRPDWVATILRAHQEHPAAAAIGGTLENGSDRHLVDWASFYAGHAPFLPPQPSGSVPFISGANVSYKRAMLAQVLDEHGERAIEPLMHDSLRARGHQLVADDRISVVHYQSRGFVNTTVLHYSSGQNYEGSRHLEHPEQSLQRAARAMLIPVPRAVRRLRLALIKRQPVPRLLLVTPFVFWLTWAQSAGEIMGALHGPGSSARRLH